MLRMGGQFRLPQMSVDESRASGNLCSEQGLAEARLKERSVPRRQHKRVASGRNLQDYEDRAFSRVQRRHRVVEFSQLPHGRTPAEAAREGDARHTAVLVWVRCIPVSP